MRFPNQVQSSLVPICELEARGYSAFWHCGEAFLLILDKTKGFENGIPALSILTRKIHTYVSHVPVKPIEIVKDFIL